MLELIERSHKRVFSLIRLQRNVSGADLARQTELQPSSLVYILRFLKEKNLIKKSGYGKSTQKGGKRPIMWEVNPFYGNIVGLEVMRRAIRAVIVDMAGNVILKVEKEFKPGKPEKTVLRIQKIIAELIHESGMKRNQLHSISIAVPGLVNPHSQQVIYSSTLNFYDFDLKSPMEKEFGIPTTIINDANAGVLGEQWFSKDYGSVSNMLYVMYNPKARGLGLGVFLNHKLYTGSNGLAGEFFSNLPFLEVIITNAIQKTPASEILISTADVAGIQVSELYSYLKRGCPLCSQVVKELSRQVAIEISKITGLFDPDKIILGGELSICEDLCCNEINSVLINLLVESYPFTIRAPNVEYAHQKAFSAAIGATALYLAQALD